MSIVFAPTANYHRLHHRVWRALVAAEPLFAVRGLPVYVTSANDGVHRDRSLHFENRAVDIRTGHLWAPGERWLSSVEAQQLTAEIQRAVGPEFDVILEDVPPHIHLEFDPK